MSERQISELLDSAETDLEGVSRSMLAADLSLLQESQLILERLVESLSRAKAAVPLSAHAWPPSVRGHLQTFHGKLHRLQILGNVAASAVAVRSQRPELSTGGYTARGCESLRPDITTIAFDY
ncbi:MAG: hypothetical protein JWO80_601 [Bryobacterales bacterium]|nr:hypothetical protein [Bryobacterales bacterium]